MEAQEFLLLIYQGSMVVRDSGEQSKDLCDFSACILFQITDGKFFKCHIVKWP